MKTNPTALWATDFHLRSDRMRSSMAFLKFLVETVQLHRPKYVIITGDTFHTKDTTSTLMQKRFYNTLEEIAAISTVIQLPGNHDWGSLYESHSLDYYQNMKNVITVNDNYILDLGNGKTANIVSYCRDVERFARLIKNDGCSHLFGHLDLNGFALGSGWEEVNACVDIDTLLRYETVNSGHYHLGQEKLIHDTLIRYLGSPYTHDMGEADQAKRLGLIDLNTFTMTDIPTEMTYHKRLLVGVDDEYPVFDREELARGVQYQVQIVGTKTEIDDRTKKLEPQAGVSLSFKYVNEQSDRVVLSMADSSDKTLNNFSLHQLKKMFPKIEFTEKGDLIVASQDLNMDLQKLMELGRKYAADAKNL